MLKDLEARSSQFTPIEIASVESTAAHKPKHNNSLLITLVMFLLAVGLTVAYFQIQNNSSGRPATVENVVQVPVTGTAVKPVFESVVEPVNQIIGLQIRESAESLSLEFSLRDKAISYLKERSENSFIYHLKDIQSEIVAPVIKDNLWIQQLSISPREEGVDIIFRTASAVLVETRQQLLDSENIWAIKLTKSPQRVAVVKPVQSSPVKKFPQPVKEKAAPGVPVEPVVETKVVKLDIKSSRLELTATEKLQRAEILIKNRRWPEAQKSLRRLINGPQDLAARTRLLAILGQNGQPDQFSELLDESIKIYPRQAIFKTEQARSLFKLNAYKTVIEYIQNIDDANATQLALLAASYQRLDQHQQAVSYYRQSLDKDGQQSKSWIGLGISQEQTANLEDALQSYRTAIKLGNINARLQTFLEKRSKQLEQALN